VGLVAVFGVYIPWLKGFDFLDPVITAAYACLGVLFAAPASAQAFANEDPVSMREVIARIVMAVVYGEIIAVTVLTWGFATVYLTHGRHFLVAPALDTLVAAGLLGITGSFALAAAAAWITMRFSANAARGAMRVVFLLMLLGFFYRSRWLPDVADTAALVCFVIAAAEFFALRRLVAVRSE
jgi:hypothetical protein